MTLCAIWEHDGMFHLASDSRITFGQAGIADIAIKIGREYYAIYGPSDNDGNKEKIASGDLAFCFAGSGIGAIFMKESLSGILTELQVVPGQADISMAGLSQLIFEAYKAISIELGKVLKDNSFVDLIIAGHCIEEKKYRSFRIYPIPFDQNSHASQKYQIEEILHGESKYLFIGSGKNFAQSEFTKQTEGGLSKKILKTLWNVIKDNSRDDVGGSLQYGRFNNKKFQTYGVMEYTDNNDYGISYWRGALDLRLKEFDDKFCITYPYVIIDDL
ncbi:hypothetical protein [Thalassospira sp.]|uniref:hypothetical protein n=1 Tax=Thalassospira sp. TaxID=1912094 RepID=UPI00311DD76C